MRVFDLQGTLTERAKANVLYRPIGQFVILSAESPVASIRKGVRDFVEANFPNCLELRFVSGSKQQIITAKVQQLINLNATQYTDNDIELLTEYKFRLPNISFYYIDQGKQVQL